MHHYSSFCTGSGPYVDSSDARFKTNITTISGAEADAFVKAAANVSDEWVAEISKRGHDGRKLLDAAKALIAKHGRA